MSGMTPIVETWVRWAVASSWQIALLAGVIAVVALATRRLSARFRYLLWSLVLIKVFLPPSLAVVWGVGHWGLEPAWEETRNAVPFAAKGGYAEPIRGPGPAMVSESGARNVGEKSALFQPLAIGEQGGVSRIGAEDLSDRSDVSDKSDKSDSSTMPGSIRQVSDWRLIALAVWLVGVFGFVGLVALRYVRLLGRLRRAEVVDEGPLRVELDRLALAMQKSNPPELLLSNEITSPFLIGLFRPRIVLPGGLVASLSPGHLRNVLLHELTHWKRGDIWVGWAQVLAQALFWFHPVVWLANAQIRHERESACDEEAIGRGQCDPAQYGESLLKVLLESRGRSATQLGFLGIFERGTKIQKRLEDIMQRESRGTGFGWGNWAFLAAFALVFLPMAGVRTIQAETAGEKSAVEAATVADIVGGAGASTLQARIDAAEPNATIAIPPGIHAGPLRITKPITLLGENADACVIECFANEPAIRIQGADGVTLKNLTVRWGLKSTDTKARELAAVVVRDSKVVLESCALQPKDRPRNTSCGLMALGRTEVAFTRGRTTGFEYTFLFTDGANGAITHSVLSDSGHCAVQGHQGTTIKVEGCILSGCEYHGVRSTGGTMEVRNNIIRNNNHAGVYLGNSSAHGVVENNLFVGNRGGIWSFAASDVAIRNNVFIDSKSEAISFHASCSLIVERNGFVNNPIALVQYSTEKNPGRKGAATKANHFWKNGTDAKDFEKESDALTGEPNFADAANFDYTPIDPSPLRTADGGRAAGLLDSEAIALVWRRGKGALDVSAPASGGAAAQATSVDVSNTSIVCFAPKRPFAPATAKELLEAFNEKHPRNVRTHHFRTQVKGDHLVGFICVDGEDGREKVKAMLEESETLVLLQVEGATPETMEWLIRMRQVSLRDGGSGSVSAAPGRPVVVEFNPPVGATDVDPALTEISVTFSQDMESGYSWTGGPPLFPPGRAGQKAFWRDKRTCVLPVTLERGRYYRVGINAHTYNSFRSVGGTPVEDTVMYFVTRGAGPEELAKLTKPVVVNLNPPNGATDVDPSITKLEATFSVPMGDGMAWCGGGPTFPKGRDGERSTWTHGGLTCALPVTLEPGKTYWLSLNAPSFNSFQSKAGIPIDPVIYTFATAPAP